MPSKFLGLLPFATVIVVMYFTANTSEAHLFGLTFISVVNVMAWHSLPQLENSNPMIRHFMHKFSQVVLWVASAWFLFQVLELYQIYFRQNDILRKFGHAISLLGFFGASICFIRIFYCQKVLGDLWSKFRSQFFIFLGSLICLILLYKMQRIIWTTTYQVTCHGVYGLLTSIGQKVTMTIASQQIDPVCRLDHYNFHADIYSACGGAEAMAVAASCLLAFWFNGGNYLTKIQFLKVGLGAIGFLFIANIFRIAIFFMLGIWIAGYASDATARDAVTQMFHSHIGWFIYLYVAFAYFQWVGISPLISPATSTSVNKVSK